MDEMDWLAQRFEQHRSRLRAVAYRMLGSMTDADDAVQDAWLRLSRSDTQAIDDLGGWLTTVVARECLHVLRSRRQRREEPLEGQLPDPIVIPDGDLDPEQEALLADSVGLALLVVLESLTPSERLAFVLHDMFDLPFEDIARMLDRTPIAARQLASRARRRVKGAGLPTPDADVSRQRRVVDAFFAAARSGEVDALARVLDPDVVLRADIRADRPPTIVRGVGAVAKMARAPRGAQLHPALVNGMVGVVVTLDRKPFAVLAFTIVSDKIIQIHAISDLDRVGRLAAPVLTQPD
jgi:RNA polymerase sigma-70 factor (ECF subfamily)